MSRKTRKLMWSVPLIAAVAVIGALAAFMTLTPNGVLAQQQEVAPGTPLNLMAAALDQTTIKLTWEKPAAGDVGLPDGYRIDYSDEDGLVWYNLVSNVAAGDTEYVDNEGLMASEERQYRIFAFNTGGSSPAHDPVSATTKASMKPDAPTALLVAPGTTVATTGLHRDNEWLVLTWRAPVNPPGAPVKTYRVQVSKDGSSFTDLEPKLSAKDAMCSGTNVDCEYTHKGLLESTTRHYRIYATNSVGESSASNKSSGKTNAGNNPGAAQNLRVSVTPAGGMALYWDLPANISANDTAPSSGLDAAMHDPNGAPILGYYVMGAVNADLAATAEFDSDDADTNADTTISRNEVYYVEANTDLTLTDSILNTLAKFDGKPNPTADTPSYWAFRVMAVNKVVQRKTADGTIDENDGTWSDGIVVNNAPNTPSTAAAETLLGTPTITKVALHAPSNQGRTGIDLGWSVTIPTGGPSERYRVEYSTDRIDWKDLPTGVDAMFATYDADAESWTGYAEGGDTGVHRARTAGTQYYYRVFALQSDTKGTDGRILTKVSPLKSLTTSTPNRPEAPTWNTDPNPLSETELEMSFWLSTDATATAPAADGTNKAGSGHERAGFGALKGYRVEVSADGKDWTKYQPIVITLKGEPYSHTYSVKYNEDTGAPTLTETRVATPIHEVKLKHTGLAQGTTRHYRVSTKNNAPGSLGYSEPSAVMNTKTFAAQGADDPAWLVAKAKGRDTIELLWTARADDITAANIKGYRIQSSPLNAQGSCAEDWTGLMKDTMSTATSYTHSGLMPGAEFCYRVFGINVVGESTGFIGFGDAYINTNDNDAIAMTYPAMAPGMPMALTATAASDMQIDLMWQAPADDGGAGSIGYVLDRKSGDGMFMTIAATDAASWWNTLDCPMMNDAVPADSTPAPGADDKTSPYCKMYDGLMADAKMVVDATFMANYGTITGMSYMDMGLMAETMYTYQVKAVNAKGASMPSAEASATTQTTPVVEPTNNAPTAPTASLPAQTVIVGMTAMVASTITDADADDTLTWTEMSSDDMIASSTVDNMGMVTITGVAAGPATITVTATDEAGESASQTIMVTVNAIPLMAPTITGTNPVGSGIVLVSWDSVANATGYFLIATNLTDATAPTHTAAAMADAKSGQIQGLTVGDEYLIFVGAFNDDLEYELSDYVRITAE